MSPSDAELLQRYAQEASDSAFAELVARHLDLVYSAARRIVRSSQLAEDVAQSVFVDLAQTAGRFPPNKPLVAWLHVVTRRTAIDVVRRESRRQAREREALLLAGGDGNQSELMKPSPAWTEIEPLLDEAVESLDPADRSAILLRFFENKSLRDVGEALGISDDTAQKRVSRALERLRTFLGKRGVAIGAASLAGEISAQAATIAPTGLGPAISTAAAAAAKTLAPSVVAASAQHLAMTATQKMIATAAIAAALGFALYEAVPAWRLRQQVRGGQQRLEALATYARELALERTAAARELARLNQAATGAPATPEPGSDAALARQAAAWLGRISAFKQFLAQHPELSIPELQLLTERDWLLAAINDHDDASPEKRDASLRFLRTRAKGYFIKRASEAARNYFAAAKTWPTQFEQLAPQLTPAIDPAIAARYDVQNVNGRFVVAEKLAGAADPDQLALCVYDDTKTKRGIMGFSGWETVSGRVVREADQAYAAAHAGTRATHPAQLTPFLAAPLDAETLAKLFRQLPLSIRRPAPAGASNP